MFRAEYTEEQQAARRRMRRERLDRMQINIAESLIRAGEAMKEQVESKDRICYKIND